MDRHRTACPTIRTIQIAKSAVLKYSFIGSQKPYLSCDPHFRERSYLPPGQGIPGRQSGSGPLEGAIPASQGLPGRQIGCGPPSSVTTPNAIPRVTTEIPSMIFVFTVPLHAAVAALCTDSKRRSSPQGPQKCPTCMPQSEANLENRLK